MTEKYDASLDVHSCGWHWPLLLLKILPVCYTTMYQDIFKVCYFIKYSIFFRNALVFVKLERWKLFFFWCFYSWVRKSLAWDESYCYFHSLQSNRLSQQITISTTCTLVLCCKEKLIIPFIPQIIWIRPFIFLNPGLGPLLASPISTPQPLLFYSCSWTMNSLGLSCFAVGVMDHCFTAHCYLAQRLWGREKDRTALPASPPV